MQTAPLLGMTTPDLTGADRRALRGEGQTLEATVTVGREGVTATNTRELCAQLGRRGLIKVRANMTDRKAREALFAELAEASDSTLVSTVGRTALYYRPLPETAQA
ncbi:YhbY family RNA-binding protein [Synoicihabitans lomoniglobus]|uniref:YhbY family RNA-binding protein n=1 Tax=Synoicihabitans lomoniglobus TaxID=2909285 RepID=A0AAF0CHS3_9BACT|nr:YhbY family RNA-binding protein [Opitutaceae bacterium LMO-M01]WED64622.1 YhbY family RNA-binding protein [Opitutaceae bacterium LMO-M01]